MLEPELPDRRAVVVPDLLLLGVEPHALPDDGVRRARVAPDREGHFEADGLRAVFAQGAWGAFGVEAVAGGGAFEVRRDVAAHVEALHFGGWFRSFVGRVVCVCVCSRVEGFLLCCSATRGELWTTAFSFSRTLSRRVWWRERDHRSGICVCEGEMFGHVMCIRGQGSGVDGETVEERASLVNVVSQKTPAGCCKSGHSRHHPTPTLRWAVIHKVCTERYSASHEKTSARKRSSMYVC